MPQQYKTVRVPIDATSPSSSEYSTDAETPTPTPSHRETHQTHSSSAQPGPAANAEHPGEGIEYSVGQKVQYKPVGGRDSQTSISTGTVERVLTSKEQAGDKKVRVNASEREPQYEILNSNTGKKTALKGKNILGVME